MCGHFALDYMSLGMLIDYFELEEVPTDDEWMNIYNLYPSRGQTVNHAPVIFEDQKKRKLDLLRWDLVPSWYKEPVTAKKFSSFNTRSEDIAVKPAFRTAWKNSQRCIIPATRFFEWPDKESVQQGQRRTEFAVSIPGTPFFSMAGIWETNRILDSDKSLRSFSIITTRANPAISKIPHKRMPVIIPPGNEKLWLDSSLTPEKAARFFEPYPDDRVLIEMAGDVRNG